MECLAIRRLPAQLSAWLLAVFLQPETKQQKKHRAKDLEVAKNPKHNDVWSFVVPQKEGTRFQETLM